MGLKRKNKANAQFNMSSLTDIIFLLLIFFMLTSTLVAPNALNLKLPGKTKTPVTQTDQLTDVHISGSGTYALNGRPVSATVSGQALLHAVDRVAVAACAGARPRLDLVSPEIGDEAREMRARLPLLDDSGKAVARRQAAGRQAAVDADVSAGAWLARWPGISPRTRWSGHAGVALVALVALGASHAVRAGGSDGSVFAVFARACAEQNGGSN
jgi:biopolymer transport protein ExbD